MSTYSKLFSIIISVMALVVCKPYASANDKTLSKTAQPGADKNTVLSFNFDGDKAGSMAKAMVADETGGTKKPATWEVVADSQAPSKPNAFGITHNENYGSTFNMALATGSKLKNVDVSVKLKAVAGKEDQGGGPVWRARDGNNYYIARWNPLEDNFRLYYVKDGRRRQLESAKIKLDTEKFHAIRVTMRGDRIECFLDGKKLLTTTDKTFMDAGMVGLWVKADGRTLFDDFTAKPAK